MIKHIAIATFCVGAMLGECYALDISTGYNNGSNSLYPAPPPYPANSGTNDNYWVAVARAAAGAPVTSPSLPYVVDKHPAWALAFPGSRWVGPMPNANSPPGTSHDPTKLSYTLFRKCFCIINTTKGVSLSFKVKSDDSIQMWLNSQTNNILPVTNNLWASQTGVSRTINSGFRLGVNCIFALVEDVGNAGGFNLQGNIAGPGLWPYVAYGVGASFKPCDCPAPTPQASGGKRAAEVDPTGEQVIKDIIAIAEKRAAPKLGR